MGKITFIFIFLIQFHNFLIAETYEERSKRIIKESVDYQNNNSENKSINKISNNNSIERFSKSILPDCKENISRNNCYGYYRANNGFFEGNFQNNQRNGPGLYKFDNGQVFFGGYINDQAVLGWYLLNGNNSEFLDLLKLGLKNNYKLEQIIALLKSFRGEWYYGQFEKDKRHGWGSIFIDGAVSQAGRWDNDLLIQNTNNTNHGDDIFQALARFGDAYNKATKQKRFLKSEWSGSSGKMCSYDDGSVDSIGFESICPLSK